MHIRPGLKLKSLASTAQFIVIRAPGEDVDLTCAGALLAAAAGAQPDEGEGGQDLQVGKRYSNGSGDLELLCTHPGLGPVQLAGQDLSIKVAQALPSSD